MPTREEIYDRILQALKEKAPLSRCPLCGNQKWTLGEGYIVAPVGRSPHQISLNAKTVFPFMPLVCSHCGNTHLINIAVLGFSAAEIQSLIFPEDG